jgi:3D (Asp-Asp-Asp) domain-containing protein
MEVFITRVTVDERYEDEVIPFETVMQASPALISGAEVVVQQGANGVRRYTYDKIYRNGIYDTEVLAGTSVYIKPVNKVIAYGAANSIAMDAAYTLSEEEQSITLEDGTKLNYDSYVDVLATAYTTEGASFNITKSGAVAKLGIIAVDPKVIPLGTKMFVVSADGTWTYGYALAGDTGGLIKGKRIDLFYNTTRECVDFGARDARVYILKP